MDKPIPEAVRDALVRLRQIAGMVEYSIKDVTMTSQEAVAIVEQALSTQTENSGPIPKAILERVARAIAEVNGADPAGWQFYQADATVAIEALTAAQQQGQAVACPYRTTCTCLGACAFGWPGNGAAAPPSAPVGVEWTDEAAHAFRKEIDSVGAHWHPWPVRFRAGMAAALAKQPAAVDDAACVHGCRCGCCRACKRGHYEPTRHSTCDCYATQHQEPTT